ncbi:hypothetical protein BXT84_02720 [Sulfobacillus thermotolerans]|uniref:Oxidoreductase molybdopterin-binding domain-containing protein n=1 Tax=Sulfobacillus thermotolerans TaxID=338644 RepID=A0ABM6RNR6_9FIRM|nr:hypothetical protein BXT84_02720 [Sulfobacillus thermotolerans]
MIPKRPPTSFSQRHWRHALWVGLFVATGFGLFLSSWRRALGPWFPAIQTIHEWGGIIYALALLGWSARFYPWPAPVGRTQPAFTRWALFFLVLLCVSGVALFIGPSWTRSIATVVHGASAAGLVIWVLTHLLTHRPTPLSRATPSSRRRALHWILATVATAPFVIALPNLLMMLSGRIFQQGRTQGALPGFVPYTVIDGYPQFTPQTWRLWVDSPVKRTYRLDELQHMPPTSRRLNFECVTGWAVNGVQVEGIDLLHFLESVGWQPEHTPWVLFFSGDGVYTESLSAEQIHQYQPLLVYAMDGQPLAASQGYPLRLLVPGMYGYKSLKWLVRIAFSPHDQLGYWEQRGYPQNAYWGSYHGF